MTFVVGCTLPVACQAAPIPPEPHTLRFNNAPLHFQPQERRRRLAAYLDAKLATDNETLQLEGAHGLWEMAIKREHHADIDAGKMAGLVARLESENLEIARLSAAAVWALCVSAGCRKQLLALNVVPVLLACVQRSLKLEVSDEPGAGKATEEVRSAVGVAGSADAHVDRCRSPQCALVAVACLAHSVTLVDRCIDEQDNRAPSR